MIPPSPFSDRSIEDANAAAVERFKRSQQSAHAHASGRLFQDELEDTHNGLANRRWGFVVPHARETVGTVNRKDGGQPGLGLRYKAGGNPVDYSGHVNLEPQPHGIAWQSAEAGPRAVRIPVIFDAKRITTGLTYRHAADRFHQLLQLKQAHKNGAAAFILVHCVALERVLMIGPHHLDTMIRHKSIQLAESPSRTILHPACAYQMGYGWPWPPLIPLACLGVIR